MSPSRLSESPTEDAYMPLSANLLKSAPIRPPAFNADRNVSKPGCARVNLAVSAEKPDGTLGYREKYKDYVTSRPPTSTAVSDIKKRKKLIEISFDP